MELCSVTANAHETLYTNSYTNTHSKKSKIDTNSYAKETFNFPAKVDDDRPRGSPDPHGAQNISLFSAAAAAIDVSLPVALMHVGR